MNAFNTFQTPDTVTPAKFDGATLDGSDLTMTLPAMSIVAVTLS
jgi:alpha-L-arabinofuranosidase